MNKDSKWLKAIYGIGIVAMILGVVDPLEGSVLIVTGSLMVAVAAQLRHDNYHAIFKWSAIFITVGVFFMFFLSRMGGLGKGTLSWWWGLLILPYPIGWLVDMITMIVRASKKPHHRALV